MAHSAVLKAELAAATLYAFLRDRPRPSGGGPAAEQHAEADRAAGDQAEAASSQRRRARDQPSGPADLGGLLADGADAPLCPAHTDWLSHRLLVTGPAAAVAAFGNAAAGVGSIPWQLDLDSLAEDWFHRLVDPAHRTLSLAGAQVLASQLRKAVEHRYAVALARVGHSRACPFDLHALLPVPAAILQHGPDHPAALAWLWQHWAPPRRCATSPSTPHRPRVSCCRRCPVRCGLPMRRSQLEKLSRGPREAASRAIRPWPWQRR